LCTIKTIPELDQNTIITTTLTALTNALLPKTTAIVDSTSFCSRQLIERGVKKNVLFVSKSFEYCSITILLAAKYHRENL